MKKSELAVSIVELSDLALGSLIDMTRGIKVRRSKEFNCLVKTSSEIRKGGEIIKSLTILCEIGSMVIGLKRYLIFKLGVSAEIVRAVETTKKAGSKVGSIAKQVNTPAQINAARSRWI